MRKGRQLQVYSLNLRDTLYKVVQQETGLKSETLFALGSLGIRARKVALIAFKSLPD